MAQGRVVIDVDRCKGCILCTTACPQDVLKINEGRLNARSYHPVEYIDPNGKCTGCALCAVICPDACFTVYRVSASPRHMKVVTGGPSAN